MKLIVLIMILAVVLGGCKIDNPPVHTTITPATFDTPCTESTTGEFNVVTSGETSYVTYTDTSTGYPAYSVTEHETDVITNAISTYLTVSQTISRTGGATERTTTIRGTTTTARVTERPTAVVTTPQTPSSPVLPGNDPIVILPTAPGRAVNRTDVSEIDYSNMADGYITLRYTGNRNRIVMQITAPNSREYNYEIINPDRTMKGFPLSDGNGRYTIRFYEGTLDSDVVSTVANFNIDVRITNQFSPFLMVNYYVNYTHGHAIVTKAAELSRGKTEIEKIEAIYNWFVDNVTYDNNRAANLTRGYVPKLANLMRDRRGICFDYASGMVAMLRSQGIPARMEFGFAGTEYHAWISAHTRDTGWVNGWIQFRGNQWVLMEPTWAAVNGDSNRGFRDFVRNRNNYRTDFIY